MKKLRDLLIKEMYEKNEEKLSNLKAGLDGDEDWLLCLGAGVSQSCGVPGWYDLLSRMLARTMAFYPAHEKDNKEIEAISSFVENNRNNGVYLKKLESFYQGKYSKVLNGMDALEAAEYVKKVVEVHKNNEDSENIELKEKIENRYIEKLIRESCKIDKLPDKSKSDEGRTLKAITHLMKNKIKTALTYNYDDLVEKGLLEYEGIGEEFIKSVVPGEKIEHLTGDIRKIFHIHGSIPIIERENSKGKIVLTEASYYEEERDGYSLANVLQSYAMTHYNLIYVGFSGADYSFRRILRGLGKMDYKTKRYIFFCLDDVLESIITICCREKIKLKIENGEKKEKGNESSGEEWKYVLEDIVNDTKDEYNFEKVLINHIVWAKTQYWEDHGLSVIWSTLDELPGCLCSLVD